MRRLYRKIIIALMINTALYGEPPTLWERTYGGRGNQYAYSIIPGLESGYIIAGRVQPFGVLTHDVYFFHIDEDGNLLWERTYDGFQEDFAYSVTYAWDDGYIMAGGTESFGAGGYDVYLVKADREGNFLWRRTYGGTQWEKGFSLLRTLDRGYVIAGFTASFGSGGFDVYFIKVDLGGNLIWQKTYGGSGDEFGWCVKQTLDGGYIIVGETHSFGPDSFNVYLIKTDAEGNLLWQRTYGGTDSDKGYSIDLTHDGGYIITGYTSSYGAGLKDVYLLKTDANGNLIWEKTYGGSNDDIGRYVEQTKDGGYIIVGETHSFGPESTNVYVIKTDPLGEVLWQKVYGRDYRDIGFSLTQTPDDGYIIVGESVRELVGCEAYVIRIGPDYAITNDSFALAYNGNRHLVRKPFNQNFHLVYTHAQRVWYRFGFYSDNKLQWRIPELLHIGSFPAIHLDSENNPCVAWTYEDTLFYARKDPVNGWVKQKYTFPYIIGSFTPSHPSITVTPGNPDTVHILLRLYIPANGPQNGIIEISFPVTQPDNYIKRILDWTWGPYMVESDFPSITYSEEIPGIPITLHAVWQHGDTIYYATRKTGEEWNVLEDPFNPEGHNSSHPFVETYGDSVFVVWENDSLKEIFRGANWIPHPVPDFHWNNLSQTPLYPSFYPVNTEGKYTVFRDDYSPPPNHGSDIFWKRFPEDIPHNISESPDRFSNTPHSVLRQTWIGDYLYTVWLEGEVPPYEIKFKKIYLPLIEYAYFSSIAGSQIPSPYLVKRDTFFSDWEIPVDIGYDCLKYKFPLKPGYKYFLKAIVYYEGSKGKEYKEWLKIDDKVKRLIKYKAFEPETIKMNIPPAFYKDSVIEVKFEKITGEYAISGNIYIYRYEYEEEYISGIQGYDTEINPEFIFPNILKDDFKLDLSDLPFKNIEISIFDITGRKILKKNGKILELKNIPKGIYFMKIKNPETGKLIYRKFIKLE